MNCFGGTIKYLAWRFKANFESESFILWGTYLLLTESAITSWQIDGETMETVRDFIFLDSKITADGDSVQFSSVQLLSHVLLFATPWTTARQASLSITNSRSLLKLMPIKLVTPSSHLILCLPLLLLPPIPPSIRVFSNESTLHVRWPKYWSFSFSINPSNEHPGLISFRMVTAALQLKDVCSLEEKLWPT